MDRIIDPNGKKMININRADANSIYRAIRSALDPNLAGANGTAAQIAVNLIDFSDYDSNVSTIKVDGIKYYGFERPCVYISEMVHKLKDINPGGPPPVLVEAYAIELYKPYSQDEDPNNWRLVLGPAPGGPIGAPLGGTPYDIHWSGHRQFYVMRNDPCGLLTSIDPCAAVENSAFVFTKGSIIGLQRCIDEVNKVWIDVDLVDVPDVLVPDPCSDIDLTRSIERDIKLHKCIRRLWSPPITNSPTLGRKNDNYTDPNSRLIQAHPEDNPFTNIGEIGMVFQKSAYSQEGLNPIGPTDTESTARLDLANLNYHGIFKYLTVFDPNDPQYGGHPETETRIKGRININTAPWYVIAQLPWMRPDIAQKIVEHRDQPMTRGFESIGGLMQVLEMGYYANDSNDLDGFPDLTPGGTVGDEAPDDFEERDVIFARISNLVTVRSDVFTAYILVRIGTNGPQKRVMAILDRSNVSTGDGKVRIIAVHPVPDPR
jgi:DNA uptake protein ComE-like DNA-binding protein